MLRFILILILLFHICFSYMITNTCKQQKFRLKVNTNAKNINDEFNWDPKLGPKLDFNEDYYIVLEVSPPPATVDSKTLKKAYYKMVFKYHPDNKEGDDAKSLCNKQMMVINAAYKILKNDNLRKEYDNKRNVGFYGAQANVKETKTGEKSTATTSSSSSSSKTTTSPPPQSSSRSSTASSSSSSSSSYNNNYQNARKDDSTYNYDSYKTAESMVDVLSELWSDIRSTGGTNIMEDVLDFLEDNFDGGKDIYSSQSSSSFNNDEQLNSEINMIKLTIKNLKLHSTILMKEYQDKELELKNSKSVQLKTVEEMESRFRKIEDIKSLQARINEVEKQIKQLERQLFKKQNRKKNVEEVKEPFSSQTTKSSPNPNPNEYMYGNKNDNDKKIEYELQLLKKKMGKL